MASSGDSDEIKQAWRQRAMASGGDGDENEEQSLALGAAWRQRGKDGRRVLWTERAGALASLLIPRGGAYARVLQDPDLIELIVRCDPRHPIADIHRRWWAAGKALRYKCALWGQMYHITRTEPLMHANFGADSPIMLWLASSYDEAVHYYWSHIIPWGTPPCAVLRDPGFWDYAATTTTERRPRFDKLTRLLISRDCALRKCFREMRARGHVCKRFVMKIHLAARLTSANYPYSWHRSQPQHPSPPTPDPPRRQISR